MATNYTPIVNDTDATAASVNSPLQELDNEIENIKGGASAMSAPQIVSFTNSGHDHADAAGGAKIPFDKLDTTGETVGNLLAVGSSNDVVTVSDKWDVGDLKIRSTISDKANIWYRCDGRTIGNAASSGADIAADNMEDLFTELWTNTTNAELVIEDSSGTPTTRGASAAADWAANKRLPIWDIRGTVVGGMDDPTGSDAANVVTDAEADVLGGSMGAETHTLTEDELAAHTHAAQRLSGGGSSNWSSGGAGLIANSGSSGGDAAHNNMQPTIFLNYFIYTGN